ncbi:Transcription factor eat1 [Thalictrum thalictroides]|uniref:Transcription factor eat1 n=1 Tax=Thalictrum thalictroides TaxID=46969 RepID=A0A7J6WHA0_THATH|nr:Transcription factor eat1 [Thalictrum thalictroides]
MLPNSSISFNNPAGNKNKQSNFPSSLDFFGEHPTADGVSSASNALYDPPLHLNLPPQQTPIFKELFHSLPHNYGLPSSRTTGSSFFGGMDERDQGLSGLYQDGDGRQFIETTSTLDFSRDMSGLGKGGKGKGGSKHAFATERQRREQLNGKFLALKNLVPSPTKSDRASIVHDAIDYIKELLRTVEELKILVDKKRYGTERSKKRKTEDEATGDMESSSMKPHSFLTEREQSNGPSRATWIQRKSKEAEVDVRIVEDEITIKLIQRKKINFLLSVSKILDELQLDLLHVSGGSIGDFYSFLFNTKIYEGSSVHGIAIANKLIETVDKNYAAFQPGNF